jgi:two-component system, LytTR family, sensor kinase
MNKTFHFILKYKLLHFGYWLISIVFFMHYRQERYGGSFFSDSVTTLIVFGGKMIAVYSVIYFLIPRFLNRRKYLYFILACFVCMMLASVLSSLVVSVYHHFINGKFSSGFLIMVLSQFIDMIMPVVIFVLAVTIYSRYESDQRNKQLEKEKLETELNFLKAQINPHFLFNALNSIYVLIGIDKDAAEKTMLRFSGLLRYQLYECKDKVEIEKELNFLNDYIGLETLRKENNLKVDYDFPNAIPYKLIAPFILIPFVENAFKHVSRNGDQPNFIDIQASFVNNIFLFSVMNSVNRTSDRFENKGIGLQNVKRRLELLYPAKHQLKIENDKNSFSVNLELNV